MKSLSVLLATLLGVTSCAARVSSTMPAVAEVTPVSAEDINDGIVANHDYHGIPGIWFTWEAWRRVVLNVKLQQRDLQVALATETVSREIAEIEAKRLRESSARREWAATYGVWLGLAGGLTVAGIIAGIIGGVFGDAYKALHSAFGGNQ